MHTRERTLSFTMACVIVAIGTTIATPIGAVNAAPASASVPISFKGQLDNNLVGGTWAILRRVPGRPERTVLGSGTILPTGTLAVSIPQLIDGSDYQFTLLATKPIDAGSGYTAIRVVGLPAASLSALPVIDFGAAASQTVARYRRGAAAGAPGCGEGCDDLIAVSRAEAVVAPVDPASVPTTGSTDPGTAATVTNQPTHPVPPGTTNPPTLAVPPCASTNSCGSPTRLVPPTQCTPYPDGSYDCIRAEYDIHGIEAFRGYSNRVAGDVSTFNVKEFNTQRWQNGLRLSSGPFQVNGTTDRTVGAGSSISWPVRGDCWDPPQPGDGPQCSYDGVEEKTGRDSWHWETDTHCSADGLCFDFELVYEISYDLGTETPVNWGPVDYYRFPSEIRGGLRGAWAAFQPGSVAELWLESTTETEFAASVSVNFPEGFGAVTFESSMRNQTTTRVTESHTLRPLPFIAWFYRYDDLGFPPPWRTEHWSCEFAAGYSGSPCLPNGS